ncbi:MAG: type IV pilin protein [Magnetococcales bacterium]|nr:type IV pilin protein [Magnetococcales bacterium]
MIVQNIDPGMGGNPRPPDSNAWGFTLLEMVAAMAVAAVLAMIAIPLYDQFIQKSRRGDALSTLEMIALAQEQWRANHLTYGTLADVWPTASSKGGYYAITITNVTGSNFLASAAALANTTQGKDAACAIIQLDQNGPVVSAHAQKSCWNR